MQQSTYGPYPDVAAVLASSDLKAVLPARATNLSAATHTYRSVFWPAPDSHVNHNNASTPLLQVI